jgi:SPP1 family phage portal protein
MYSVSTKGGDGLFAYQNGTEQSARIVKLGADTMLTQEEFLCKEIRAFLAGRVRKEMIDGVRYYAGRHDILRRKRTGIGEGGESEEITNLPNNRVVDNQYKKAVDQKANYLLGRPVTVQTENTIYADLLGEQFDKSFLRTLKNVGRDSLNCGVGWLFLYYDAQGTLAFRRFAPWEVIAGWADADHTQLDYAIRVFDVIAYEGKNETIIHKVEVYGKDGIRRYIYDGRLTADEPPQEPYFSVDGAAYNWEPIPLIAFKRDAEETPLIRGLKSLQDGLNLILSNFQNNMEEDARNTILVLVNYDGENLAEFRRNLARFGAVKIKTIDGAPGDVRTLSVEVKAENYKAILEIFKKAIIENAMAFDAKDDRLGGAPNQMNILSMYSDIDLDANAMETEYQSAFEALLKFFAWHLSNTGQGDYGSEQVEVIFNRDMLMNETEIIANVKAMVGILSDETIIAQIPWVNDVQDELDRIKKQRSAEIAASGADYAHEHNGVPQHGQA